MYPNKKESSKNKIWSHVLRRNKIAYLTTTFYILGNTIIPIIIPSLIKIDIIVITPNKRLSVGNKSIRWIEIPNNVIWYKTITRRDMTISKTKLPKQEYKASWDRVFYPIWIIDKCKSVKYCIRVFSISIPILNNSRSQ